MYEISLYLSNGQSITLDYVEEYDLPEEDQPEAVIRYYSNSDGTESFLWSMEEYDLSPMQWEQPDGEPTATFDLQMDAADM